MAPGSRPAASPVSRGGAIGLVTGFLIGGVVGLIVGLAAYPPTAWFAVFELGVPAAIVGAALGLTVGGVVALVRRIRGRRAPTSGVAP